MLKANGEFYSYKVNYASCKSSKGSHFSLSHEKKLKMNKIHEKENARGFRLCSPVTYHHDLAILDCVFYVGHVSGTLGLAMNLELKQ